MNDLSTQIVCRLLNDAQTGMLPGYPESAICVQRFDDSLNSAIHTTYRNWLRSSSMHEPRDPPLEVFSLLFFLRASVKKRNNVYKLLNVRVRPTHIHQFKLLTVVPHYFLYITSSQCKYTIVFTVMILPQVHLRKPCYDFYFL